MLQKSMLLALLLCMATIGHAQLGILQPDFKTYVFGDKINVRNAPDAKAVSVTQLVAGDLVTIVEATPTVATINRITLPWYKIKFAGGKTGFVWGGVLSFLGETQTEGIKFVLGVTAQGHPTLEDSTVAIHTFELRAVKNGAIVSTCVDTMQTMDAYSFTGIVEPDARGLKGFKNLLSINLMFGACGYPWYDWSVLWDGKKLVGLPICTSISEAGLFSHAESYVFPQGNPENENEQGHYGDENLVLFQINHSEREDREDGLGWNEDEWTRTRAMRRVGNKFVRPVDMGEPK
jgi:Bacterial SH3 domain